jgi:hypothetical protein
MLHAVILKNVTAYRTHSYIIYSQHNILYNVSLTSISFISQKCCRVAFLAYYGISKNKWSGALKTRSGAVGYRNAERRANSSAWLTNYFEQVFNRMGSFLLI